ncbi:MAG: DUF3352 domain-containing protein [Candidatus Caldatribacteriota bacterium]|nr:DUF3352 domain-containing protein [Candidatus Caldatribacteriota bacterium]
MSKKINLFVLTLFLLFTLMSSFAYGNSLLEVIPEKVIAVLELADSEIIKSVSEMNMGTFTPPKGLTGVNDYKVAREDIKKELGFDVLDPLFLENIFSEGVVISCVGVSVGGTPEILIAVSPSDEHAFLKFVGAVEAKNELEEEISNYKGIDIVKIILPEEEDTDSKSIDSISYAFLGKTLVIGENSLPIKKSIEVYKGEKNSLLKNSEYTELKTKTLEKLEFSQFFACLFSEELYKVMDELAEVVEEEDLARTLESSRDSLENMSNIGMAGGYREKNFKTYIMAPQASENYLELFKKIDVINLQSLHMLPKNTFFYLAGLTPFTWEEMKEEMIDENLQANLDENMGQVQSKTGIDIENILSVLPSQEFSIGLFDSSAIFPKVGLLTGFSSEEKLKQNIYPLIANFAPIMGGQLMDGEYEGINYKSLPNPMFPVAYGIVGDRFVVSTGINDIIDTQKGSREALDKSEAINYMLSFPNVISLLYIDMTPITQIAERFIQMSKQSMQQTQEEQEVSGADTTEAMMENLRKLKNVLFWAGTEEDYVYAWLEINYK